MNSVKRVILIKSIRVSDDKIKAANFGVFEVFTRNPDK
jgi:hypothetical protein